MQIRFDKIYEILVRFRQDFHKIDPKLRTNVLLEILETY